MFQPAASSSFVDPRVMALLRDRSVMPASGVDLVGSRPAQDPYAGTPQGLPTYDSPVGKALGDTLLMLGGGGDRLARSRTARALLDTPLPAGGGGGVAGDGADVPLPPMPTSGDPFEMQVWQQQVAAITKAKQAAADAALVRRKTQADLDAAEAEATRRKILEQRADEEYALLAPKRELEARKARTALLEDRAASGAPETPMLGNGLDYREIETANARVAERQKAEQQKRDIEIEKLQAEVARLKAEKLRHEAQAKLYEEKAKNPQQGGARTVPIGTTVKSVDPSTGMEILLQWTGEGWAPVVAGGGAPNAGDELADEDFNKLGAAALGGP